MAMWYDNRSFAGVLGCAALAGCTLLALPAGAQPAQTDYLKASNVDTTEFGDWLGYAVAISGDTMVVGASGEASGTGDPLDNSADTAGAAYVYVKNGGDWQFEAYLKPHNPGSADQFGYAVDISGDTIVVGALHEDTAAQGPFHAGSFPNSNSDHASGAAYVFVRDNGAWTQQAMLKATNSDGGHYFGADVVIEGDTIVVGARGESSDSTGVNGSQENSGAGGSGAAYVFVRNAGIWALEAYLKASNAEGGDNFGRGLAISGDTVAVGAFSEDGGTTGVNGDESDNTADRAGAVYIFVRNGATWTQEAYIKASNTDPGDQFGGFLSLHNDTLAVGSTEEKSSATGINPPGGNNSFNDAGAAYVFVRDGTTWSEQAYIKASNTHPNDLFGAGVGVYGDLLLVGAPREDSSATGIDGDQSSAAAMDSGAAYLFERTAGSWAQVHYLKASNTLAGDWFGYQVAIEGLTLAVGAIYEDRVGPGDTTATTATDSGAAYVFEIPDTEPPTITAPADIVTTATAPAAIDLGSPTVDDNAGAAGVTVGNDAPPGGFPYGVTTVTWTATDGAGNSATDTQSVTVNIPGC